MAPDKIFSALGDPTRRAILESLINGSLAAGEIADKFSVSWPAISRHLRILRIAGLVWEVRAGRTRCYELNPQALASVQSWLSPFRVSPPAPVGRSPVPSLVGREYSS